MIQSFDHLRGPDGISNDQIAEHLKLYAGYAQQVNQLNEQLPELRSHGQASRLNPEFAELARRLGFEYNGMVLHEYYFADLRPAAEPMPRRAAPLSAALAQAFGSVEDWRTTFQAIGEMRGVGWVVLFQDPVTRQLTNQWISLHQNGIPAGFKPLLIMDVWEHAFMRDYRASDKKFYTEAFFRNIDWPVVERRLLEDFALRPTAAA